MEEKTKKTIIYVLMGIAAVGVIMAIVSLCAFTLEFDFHNNGEGEAQISFFTSCNLFGIKSDLPADFAKSWNKLFEDSSFNDGKQIYETFFKAGIEGVNTTPVVLAMICAVIGCAVVVAGYAVRIFAKKRTVSTALMLIGFLLAIVGAILYVIMLTNMNGDFQEAMRMGLYKAISPDNVEYNEFINAWSIYPGSSNVSTILPFIGFALCLITSAVTFFKPLKKVEF